MLLSGELLWEAPRGLRGRTHLCLRCFGPRPRSAEVLSPLEVIHAAHTVFEPGPVAASTPTDETQPYGEATSAEDRSAGQKQDAKPGSLPSDAAGKHEAARSVCSLPAARAVCQLGGTAVHRADGPARRAGSEHLALLGAPPDRMDVSRLHPGSQRGRENNTLLSAACSTPARGLGTCHTLS